MSSWIETHARGAFEEVAELDVAALSPGRHHLAVALISDGTSQPVRAPVIVVKGAAGPGPVFGLTAAVHGNELNGIPTIHRLMRTIDPATLEGTLVGVTIVNVPGYLRHERLFPDARDLNRVMPGKDAGRESSVYAHRLMERILSKLDVLIDLHTASFGRVNTLYVRADMRDPATAMLARTIGPQIIVHNEGADGTVRSSVADRGVPAITVEIGDPQIIDRDKVREARIGIRDCLENMGMVPPDAQEAPETAIECVRSYWLYTDAGGFLEVRAPLGSRVAEGAVIATLMDPWGGLLRTYRAPEAGVVVGRSTNPVASSGARILHLGIEGRPGQG
ncbi:MAG: succinylglutamate desuccinylase/aspartoacylase family protein [Myxococcota bacterium]